MEAGNSRVSRPLRTKWSRSRLPYTPLGQASMRSDEWPRIKYASVDFGFSELGLRKAAKTETGGKYKELRGYCIDFRLTKAKFPTQNGNRIQRHAFSWKVCGILIHSPAQILFPTRPCVRQDRPTPIQEGWTLKCVYYNDRSFSFELIIHCWAIFEIFWIRAQND